jgi:predicted ATP-grasp superfamily ATP-dependent carboligase
MTEPVLVCAFRGWNDAGEAATAALEELRRLWGATRIGDIEPDNYLDLQVSRPIVHLENGLTRRIDWPPMDLFHARPQGHDVLLFLGTEPNVRWKSFTRDLLDGAQDLGVRTMVTLGAFLADAPHSRPTPVNMSSADPELAARLGLQPSRYEGPTGIVGVVHDAAGSAGLTSMSLWAAAPHYVATGPNPKAALALLEALAPLLGLTIEADGLARAVPGWESRVDEAIAEDDDMAAYVRRLEEVADEPGSELDELATGESIAAELERFLRERPEQG